jgi:hypothetical protein
MHIQHLTLKSFVPFCSTWQVTPLKAAKGREEKVVQHSPQST